MKLKDLPGKTISEVAMLRRPEFDDEAWLRLRFTDGTECVLVGFYGGFTGNSEDEYPAYIGLLREPVPDLVPVESERT